MVKGLFWGFKKGLETLRLHRKEISENMVTIESLIEKHSDNTRRALEVATAVVEKLNRREEYIEKLKTGHSFELCPACGGNMYIPKNPRIHTSDIVYECGDCEHQLVRLRAGGEPDDKTE